MQNQVNIAFSSNLYSTGNWETFILMCIFLLTSAITGCSSGKSELEVKNISSELSSEQISQEDSSDISEQYSVDNGVINNENTVEAASNEQISQEDNSDVSKQHHVNDDVIGNESTTELTIENSLNTRKSIFKDSGNSSRIE